MIGLNKIGLNQVQLNRLRLNAPFPAYGKMAGGGGSGDGFPQLPGDVTRWHFGGLTNEMMAAMDDPRIEDADHKGRFLSFKNFAWKGMSGVGGYVQDFNDFRNNATVDKIRIDEQGSNSIKVTILTTGIGNAIYIPKNIYQFNKSYFIKISSEGYDEGDMALSFYASSTSTATTVKVPLNPNGVTEIPAIKEDDFLAVYINVSGKVGSFTVEQLPLYPGALVFDGVDDCGVCDNFPILTKEKGYTVEALRQWITRGEIAHGLVSNVKNWLKDGAFLLEYRNIQADHLNKPISFGAIGSEMDLPHILTYQTSKSCNGVSITTGNFEGTDVLHVGKLAPTNVGTCINAAIWELVFLDHDATEEELTKIKDYFVKTYPWLFPDQAWTVVGKTNEDEDRATIANITGNGNDLILSNFGFAEGSGYNEEGEYAGYLVTDGVDDMIGSSIFEIGKDFTIIAEWKFMDNIIANAGISKALSLFVYNTNKGLRIFINNTTKGPVLNTKTLKAICSDGRVYSDDWSEMIVNEEQPITSSKSSLLIGINGNNFAKIALKNLAIYNQILSKDDCIKAYNYLQTLKAK